MKIKVLGYLILTLAVTACLPGKASAQDDQTGSAGAAYLLVPTTAQTASLGSTLTSGVSTLNGIEAMYANPAGLVLNQGTSVLFSRMNYVADIGVNTLGLAHRLGNNNIALNVSMWDMGEIALQTEERPEKSDLTWTAPFFQVGLTYARQFTDRIAAGVTTKLLSETIDDMNATGVAFDAGMTYVVGESGVRFGVSLKNFGTKMAYDGDGLTRQTASGPLRITSSGFELPSELNFGASYRYDVGSDASFTLLGNFRSNAYEEDQYASGLEVGVRNLVFLRGGYTIQADQDDSFYQGWNMGAGLNVDVTGFTLKIDYAYRGTRYFDGVQMLTASVML